MSRAAQGAPEPTSPPRQAGGLVEQRAWACTQGLSSRRGTAFHDTNGGIMFTGSQDRAPTNRQLHIEERGRGTPVSKVDDRTNAADERVLNPPRGHQRVGDATAGIDDVLQ